jgi:hypothetical protein
LAKLKSEDSKFAKIHDSKFNIAAASKFVPKFQEYDLDMYFLAFEKTAQLMNWPKENWAMLLQTQLTGKSLEVYSSLDLDSCRNYEVVKDKILQSSEQVPEVYRQKFRQGYKKFADTFVEFARQKETLFDKWIRSKNVDNFEKLKQLILVEEFLDRSPYDIKVFVAERNVATLAEAARLADEFNMIHGKKGDRFKSPNNYGKANNSQKFVKSDNSQSKQDNPRQDSQNSQKTDKNSQSKSGTYNKDYTCAYCKSEGHLIGDCKKLQYKENKNKSSSSGSISKVEVSDRYKCRKTEVPEIFRCFSDKGILSQLSTDSTVSTDPDSVSSSIYAPKSVVTFRDTGAQQTLLLKGAFPESMMTSENQSVLLRVFGDDFIPVPLYKVHLDCKYYVGPVVVGLTNTLPIDGVQLLIGNDIGGDSVLPIVRNHPVVDEKTEDLEKMFPGIFPTCAVTRSQSKTLNKSNLDSSVGSVPTED